MPRTGDIVSGRYRLESEIGRGGAGVVFRARDLTNDRSVALKVLNVVEANAIAREQFSRESAIASRLSDPHVIQVYDTGFVVQNDPQSAPFIAMELNQGTSLDRLRNLTLTQIINIGIQICDALESAHSRGIVHRDLKPQNVFVEKHGLKYNVKLGDFGLAYARGEGETPAAGTVYYIAPEVIAGQAPDVAADLYSLGAMLYEMVTGRVPFSNFDEESILSQHLNEPVTPTSSTRADVPFALDAIITRLLAKNPADRFSSARAVREELEKITVSPSDFSRGNLPTDFKFSGHTTEIETLSRLVETNRFVTLVDLNESERSQIVLLVGKAMERDFRDGVWVIGLEPTAQPASVPEVIAQVLNVQPGPGRNLVVALGEYLREKNLLLLLNYCSELSVACGQFSEAVLQRCPEVCLLAASDRPLGVANEVVFSIAEKDAVRRDK